MELRDSTLALITSSNPATLLKLADKYIETYNAVPDRFVLPREHVVLKPVIESFHDSLGDFVAYLRAIRNYLSGVEKDEVHRLYRTILTRHVQQVRRSRVERALKSVEKMLGRKLDSDERKRLGRKLEQHWHARREALRRANKGAAQGQGMFDEFWKTIDTEIENGDLPMFKF